MKQIAQSIESFTQDDIYEFEKNEGCIIKLSGQEIKINSEDAEIISEDIPAGWLQTTEK